MAKLQQPGMQQFVSELKQLMHVKLKFVEMWHALWLFLRDNFIINGWLDFSIADICQLF